MRLWIQDIPFHPTARPRQAGSVLVLVMVMVVIATLVGVTFMTTAATTTAITQIVDDHAQARQIAEVGLQLGIRYLEEDPNWQARLEEDVWVSQFAIHGGSVTLEAHSEQDAQGDSVPIANPSFEGETRMLAAGTLLPLKPAEMSRTIGGWQVSRTGTLLIPITGIRAAHYATDGHQVAVADFSLALLGSSTFERQLDETLRPGSLYKLKVDIGTGGLAGLLAQVSVEVKAGGVVVASASGAQLLILLDLSGTFATYELAFMTDDAPPAGPITLRFKAEALLGVASAAVFDHVRLEVHKPRPVLLTATARHGDASHVVRARIFPQGVGQQARILTWDDL